MPADRLLNTLLRSLQTYTDRQDTPRILSTATLLLLNLTNQLNLTLLTSHLLAAPALWDRPDGLETCLRVMSVFHSAAATRVRESDAAEQPALQSVYPDATSTGGRMSREEWCKAIVKGADNRSHRWKHTLVLGGLLVGFNGHQKTGLSRSMNKTLEGAFVRAANLALVEAQHGDELGAHCVTLVLNHAFPVLSDSDRARLNYNGLLPVLMGTAYFSSKGFQSAYFLASVDQDVRESSGGKFSWAPSSQSARQISRVLSRPLVSSMGPLSRLIAHCVENVTDSWLVQAAMEDLASFSRILMTQWRETKLSEVDATEEQNLMTEETLAESTQMLWRLLRSTLFATVIILRAAVGRLLNDGNLASDAVAPVLAAQALHTLRNLCFISFRTGTDSFSQYTFTYLTTIDILSAYHIQADAFIKNIRPVELGQIPRHSLDRCLDLYFLNTSEHFTFVLTPSVNEDLVTACTPYLTAAGNNHLLPIFEAAHSVMLSVLCAPQSASLTTKYFPFYVSALFAVFPSNLSPHQFRFAFKTLIRVSSPPSLLSETQPDLTSLLMEMVHHRALNASTASLVPPPGSSQAADGSPLLSEQAVLVLTFIDALPNLPLHMLEESLPVVAELVDRVAGVEMQKACRERLWEVLVGGEMDPERAEVCVAWWSTRGKAAVLSGNKSRISSAL